MSSYATHETTERDDLLFGDDILEVLGRSVEWHFLDGLGGLTGVLVKRELFRTGVATRQRQTIELNFPAI